MFDTLFDDSVSVCRVNFIPRSRLKILEGKLECFAGASPIEQEI